MRRLLIVVAAAALILLGVSGWATWRATQVRSDLLSAQGQLAKVQNALRDGRIDQAKAALPALRRRLARAHERAHGESWAVATRMPVLGRNLLIARRVADAGQLLGDKAVPLLVRALDTVREERLVRAGAIDLAVLGRIADDIQAAARASTEVNSLLRRPADHLVGSVRTGLADAQRRVSELDAGLQRASRALTVAPGMLGAQGPRTYFLAVQNNAEARATGGLIGAYAIVRADRGRLILERTGTNRDFVQSDVAVAAPLGAAKTWQDIGSTRAWYDANLSPHFPDVAQAVTGLWRAQSGQQVDGVIGLDPVVMQDLLQAGPPVRLADGTGLGPGAQDLSDFVWHTQYVRYPDLSRRKDVLGELAGAVFHTVLAARNPTATTTALLTAVRSGHLFLWSRNSAEQRLIADGPVGGALPRTNVPYLSVLTQNFGGNKLDFYLRRRVSVRRRPDGRLAVKIVLQNTTPTGVPPYVSLRSDAPHPPVPAGQSRVGLAVYGAMSTSFSDVVLDGSPTVLTLDTDHGLAFGTTTVEIPRARTVTLELIMTEPQGTLAYRQQPLVAQDELKIRVPYTLMSGRTGKPG